MNDLTLCCLVVNDTHKPMGETFARKIRDERKALLGKWDTANISLWKPSDDFKLATSPLASLKSDLKQLHLDRESGTEANNKAVWLNASSTVEDEFRDPMPKKCIHVLVQLLASTGRAAHKRYREEVSETLKRLRAKKVKTTQLSPPLRDLFAILDQPLNETEKIAISHDTYRELITPLHERNETCKEEDVAILFKKSESKSPLYSCR
ncbi:hypothetical protein BU17DRAFT_70361 [Hysterangium stoloniferum]|nr:hypothetical protein BU17DRAFT_70361 [Hysterangium stoloniferum]